MSKFLYGASVQGIQEFIFKTNKLQEIVGASEIIKNIAEFFENNFVSDTDKILLNAAGNIKVIFDTEKECQKTVLEFPKMVMQYAYGITISQAVVSIENGYAKDDINKLEKRLKIQRNKPSIPLDSSMNIMKLNPKTAKPLVNKSEDRASKQKLQANENFYKKNPNITEFKDFSYMSNIKNKLAIIHIDGNGLGKLIPELGDKLSIFSKSLDDATRSAVKDAKEDYMHIRDIIIGGDDVTMICDADDALEFTKNFLKNFEQYTSNIEELNGITDKLTACAGIAFCNEKYPFHYAVNLAETLCSVAKNHSKRESSCLMFHNIQSSNYQTWSKFVEDELTIRNDKDEIRCDFGPYYLDRDDQPNISDFLNSVGAYACDDSPISRLRNWLSELGKSSQYSNALLERINEMAKQNSGWDSCIMDKNLKEFDKELSSEKLIIKKDTKWRTPIYDILQILSVTEAK